MTGLTLLRAREPPPPRPPRSRPAPWRNRIISHGGEAPDQLLANPFNWRVHPQHQKDALEGVLDQVGWVQDVIVNQHTGHVVDGHLRVSAAITRGEPSVPVLYVDLDEDEERIVLATLDPLSAMAGQDDEVLSALLSEVSAEGAVAEMLDGLTAAVEYNTAQDADLEDPDDDEMVDLVCPERGHEFEMRLGDLVSREPEGEATRRTARTDGGAGAAVAPGHARRDRRSHRGAASVELPDVRLDPARGPREAPAPVQATSCRGRGQPAGPRGLSDGQARPAA